MTDYPIIFSGEMVRALLDGKKTMTRRTAWRECHCRGEPRFAWPDGPRVACSTCNGSNQRPTIWQKVRPGDRLYVREAWRTLHKSDCLRPRELAEDFRKITFEADPENRNPLWAFGKLRRSLHMPRWASRLTLEVTATKMERLGEITWEDAIAEGVVDTGRRDGEPWPHCEIPGVPGLREAEAPAVFLSLWERLYGCCNVDEEVVALTFAVHHQNIDRIAA